jgi:threonine/homoserine efflux transporter RhtA
MSFHLSLAPVVALIAGIIILLKRDLLPIIVAVYLIVIGLLGLFK